MSAEIDRAQLARILGMLGSDHDGEVAAAGRAADRLVRQAGLRWPDIVLPALPPPSGDPDDPVEFVLRHPDPLTDWERQFALSLARQRKPPSKKQLAILHQLVEKCRTAAGRAA